MHADHGQLPAILAHVVGADGRFGHRQHVQLAYLAVRRDGLPDAVETVCGWIRQLAAYERAPQKYHYTVSRAWVDAVGHHLVRDGDGGTFDPFVGRHPALLDKRLLSRHYRSTTLAAAPARTGWVEPDLAPFPWSAGNQAPGTSDVDGG
jgi:hypothetical protein